jgi:hypothetical protein
MDNKPEDKKPEGEVLGKLAGEDVRDASLQREPDDSWRDPSGDGCVDPVLLKNATKDYCMG